MLAPWWRPDRYADKRPFLLARVRIMQALRDFFVGEGFIEVDPGILQVSPGNETHLAAFETFFENAEGDCQSYYLHTSPEFACKKLLAAGEEKIFTFSKVFRNRDKGPWHAPEFTMLEWYRANTDYKVMMADCAQILRVVLSLEEVEIITVQEAFIKFLQFDIMDTFVQGEFDAICFAQFLEARGFHVDAQDNWSDLFAKAMGRIEPHLGQGRPVILKDYPVPEGAWARTLGADPRLAERFELYVNGIELANAYGELTDTDEQRARIDAAQAEQQRRYGYTYPIDEDFLEALTYMPPASGCALGFDRLVMMASHARRIDDVLWTPSVG